MRSCRPDAILSAHAGLPVPTFADIRLFASLIRFDAVYYARMKLNLRYIRNYPNLQARTLAQAMQVSARGRPEYTCLQLLL